MVILTAWEGKTLKKKPEADTFQRNEELILIEQIYVEETELEMVTTEHTKTTEEGGITYELTEEEERLGIKF